MSKRLITCALPYANGRIHFGHIAGAYLAGDVHARFSRMQGDEVLFVSGSDEYGVAITLSAEKAGHSPQEHVDHYHAVNKAIFDRLAISFDHYARTTWEGHPETVQAYFHDLLANGFIELQETEQLYDDSEGRFLADRYVVGTCPYCSYEKARGDECPRCGKSYEATDLINPRSKVSDAPLVLRKTSHWFLLLDKLAPKLEEWIGDKDWKPNVLNFAKHYLEDLRPRAITRDANWGVPVPLEGGEGKVFYVWFEACIGYISASREWNEERWREFWCDDETEMVQFLGKDNIFFHALMFPAMTLGQNEPYKRVDHLSANEFLTLEGHQFSKSEGWYIEIDEFLSTYSVDQLRYCLAANAPENSDSEFTWHDFQQRCNAELLGKYGNLANRTLVFLQRRCGGKAAKLTNDPFLDQIAAIVEEAKGAYAGFSTRRACQAVMELAQAGNTYFDHQQPWKVAKEEARIPEMEAILARCLHCLKVMAIISSPLIPTSAQKLWEMLGFTDDLASLPWEEALARSIEAGTALPEPTILFQKVEDDQIAAELAKLGAKQ